jgi:chorismate synthase
MRRWLTAGESHGPAISAIIEGVPSGLPLLAADINRQLQRRQLGYGRGGRMKIESDQVIITAGVRHGLCTGGPIHLQVVNRDFANWQEEMAIAPPEGNGDGRKITRPRPGHADLAGMIKYRFNDARNVLERASARETTMRVAVGAVARQLLRHIGMEIGSHVVAMGEVAVAEEKLTALRKGAINKIADASPVRCLDDETGAKMVALIEARRKAGDTSGGIIEVVMKNPPIGLGSYVHWDQKLDARLAAALISIQAVKGVEVGLGFASAALPGSQVHDEMAYENGRITRLRNHAGGFEGGMTNGEDILLRLAMKPISTMRKALRSVNVEAQTNEQAHFERADVAAVAACGVVAEAVTCSELARAVVEKYGGDSLTELSENFTRAQAYSEQRLTRKDD